MAIWQFGSLAGAVLLAGNLAVWQGPFYWRAIWQFGRGRVIGGQFGNLAGAVSLAGYARL